MTIRNKLRRTGALAAAIGFTLGGGFAVNAQSTLDAPRPIEKPGPQTTTDRAEARTQERQAQAGSAAFDKLVQQYPDLSTFAKALRVAGLEDTLTDGSPYTVFAPTNEALAKKGGTKMDELLQPKNHEQLVAFLHAHIVAEPVDLQSPRDLPATKTVDGEKIDIDRDKSTAKIEDAKVVNLNGIDVGNLKIYAIDDVLSKNGKTPSAQVSTRTPPRAVGDSG